MTALQVRDFPPDLYEELKEYAAEQNRSIAQQTIVAIREMLQSRERGKVVRHDRVQGGIEGDWYAPLYEDSLEREQRAQKKRRLFDEIENDPWYKADITIEDVIRFAEENDREQDKKAEFALSFIKPIEEGVES